MWKTRGDSGGRLVFVFKYGETRHLLQGSNLWPCRYDLSVSPLLCLCDLALWKANLIDPDRVIRCAYSLCCPFTFSSSSSVRPLEMWSQVVSDRRNRQYPISHFRQYRRHFQYQYRNNLNPHEGTVKTGWQLFLFASFSIYILKCSKWVASCKF